MIKALERIKFWIGNSRPFSLPITILSWLIVFLYSLKEGGSIINGILALIGISFAHLATNLVDDYIDCKTLLKNPFIDKSKSKCEYIKSGNASLKELKGVIVIYCVIASIIGGILLIKCGVPVLFLALIGGIIVLSYPKLSSHGLGELTVGIAFGPLFFEGIYYVMTGDFSQEVLFLSLAIVSFTTILLLVNNFMDYDSDIQVSKTTLCTKIGQNNALKLVYLIALNGYLFILLTGYLERNLLYLITLLSFPFVVLLCKSLKTYSDDKTKVPQKRWWNSPMGNWNQIVERGNAPFYFNLFSARNLAIWFMLLSCIAVGT